VKKPVPFGKYYLLERINVGGMAEVFRSKAYGVEGFERLVAVKRILPNIAEDKDFIKMFIDEAKIAVQLNHANIAQIFDLGVVDTSYYIALEHVHGRDLRAVFDRGRSQGEPMPVAQACFVIMKVCEGLDYAHNKRDQSGGELHLVHRDVSPQNVLVSFEGEVKIIDFGIAKAAGKGSKTQAGILKGKFGYMSPEQVRGLPIDRRSDVFSCGIVLYELLTGERLFVGESDFSTLEKVRNVEILPPSTYNRKIPDELERIVLKALAKDVEDRYQNAIDLHDELQAFVYTAGEFYSRKDLAAWMKRTFAKEIEEETVKLEQYRQLKPPAEIMSPRPGPTRPPPAPPPGRRTTAPPIPPPGAPAGAPPRPVGPPRQTLSMPAVMAPPSHGPSGAAAVAAISVPAPMPPPSIQPPMPMPSPAPAPSARPVGADSDLSWDDDELETQIYDNPEEEIAARAAKMAERGEAAPLPPIGTLAAAAVTPTPPPAQHTAADLGAEPDLSSLVSSSKGWDAPGAGPPRPGAVPTLVGVGAVSATGTPVNGSTKPPRSISSPGLPFGTDEVRTPSDVLARRFERDEAGRQPVAVEGPAVAITTQRTSPADRTPFGASLTASRPKTGLYAAIAGAAVLLGGGAIALMSLGGDDGTGARATAAPAAAAQPAGGEATAPDVLAASGFDLYVTPSNVVGWRLDGEIRTARLPAQIRSIAPGAHSVAIDAPPGFMSHTQEVVVEAGKAQKVAIELKPLDIVGVFESTPPASSVYLVAGGERTLVGKTPVEAKLDPRQAYQVVFERDGYVAQTRPLALSGAPREKEAVVLEKAAGVAAAPAPRPTPRPAAPRPAPTPAPAPAPTPTPAPAPAEPAVARGDGTLMLGAKPPCDIFVDGKNTGLKTPQRDLKLSAGKHKITLINNEYGIREAFTVDIKAGEQTKMVKDFSDRLPSTP
jgi:serine/threonine protein kinase